MKITIAFIALVLISMLAAEAQDTFIPSTSLENYWDSFGSPQLEASLAGTNEFDRSSTVKLYADLNNHGRIMGFDSDKDADTKMEKSLADREFDYEAERTTALAITGTLRSSTDLIEVQSGEQVIESLRSGERSRDPMEFTIEIASHAPAGTYPMFLDLTYDYQYNAEVTADELDPIAGLIGFQVSYWYQRANQTIKLPVVIKKQADFEIVGSHSELAVGGTDGTIEATYKNIGEEPAEDSVVRLSLFLPFSSTDDQAYLGTMEVGDEKAAIFKIDVDEDATAKEYGIQSEIKYTDVRGDTVISESMQIPVDVVKTGGSSKIVVLAALIALAAAGFYLYKRRKA